MLNIILLFDECNIVQSNMAESIKGFRVKPTYEDVISVAKPDGLQNVKSSNRDASFLRWNPFKST